MSQMRDDDTSVKPSNTDESKRALFDRLCWRDPINGGVLEPIVTARTPAGVPICGALRRQGMSYAYPIVDCIARLTPDLAYRYTQSG